MIIKWKINGKTIQISRKSSVYTRPRFSNLKVDCSTRREFSNKVDWRAGVCESIQQWRDRLILQELESGSSLAKGEPPFDLRFSSFFHKLFIIRPNKGWLQQKATEGNTKRETTALNKIIKRLKEFRVFSPFFFLSNSSPFLLIPSHIYVFFSIFIPFSFSSAYFLPLSLQISFLCFFFFCLLNSSVPQTLSI